MNHIDLDLKFCYGIGSLKERLELDKRHVAIYASNGVMKSSLAQAFGDIGKRDSKDSVFTRTEYLRSIKDDKDNDLEADSVLVIKPYRGDKDTVQASQGILASERLRSEYREIIREMEDAKEAILKHLAAASGMRDGAEDALLRDFGHEQAGADKFFELMEQLAGLDSSKFEHFRGIKYADINNAQVQKMLSSKKFRKYHDGYVSRYNRVLLKSHYLNRNFDHTSAQTACKQLAKSGFFDAHHQVRLISSKNQKPRDLTSGEQFEGVVSGDLKEVGEKFLSLWQEIDAEASRNQQVRNIRAAASERPLLLAELGDPDELRRNLWRAHLSEKAAEIAAIASRYRDSKARIAEILEEAERESTDWDEVIKKYNKRFAARLELSVANRAHALLGTKRPVLKFTFRDHDGAKAPIERDRIPSILSEGENRAFYMLNALFEIEGRLKRKKETVIVVDDIADSFDYKNKHAITQYLKELSAGHGLFHLIILTHNFDFFRTVCRRRIVEYDRCYYVGRSGGDMRLVPALSIKGPLDHLLEHVDEAKKFIAAVPFARNIIGHTRGTGDKNYAALSAVLHCKAETGAITARKVWGIMARTFPKASKLKSKPTFAANAKMHELVEAEAAAAAAAAKGDPDRLDLEDKTILAIYIRVAAERFMLRRLGDGPPDGAADSTYELAERYREKFRDASDGGTLDIIDRVVLTVPDIIHLNAFMYEPILDMSADGLARLYDDVRALATRRAALDGEGRAGARAARQSGAPARRGESRVMRQ